MIKQSRIAEKVYDTPSCDLLEALPEVNFLASGDGDAEDALVDDWGIF